MRGAVVSFPPEAGGGGDFVSLEESTKDIYNPVLSHVGGVVRMLDIPIIVLEEKYDSDKISKLKAFGENASLRILVDESVPLGGIKKI